MHTVRQYFWHWLTAVNDHSLQAPFIYDFYTHVLKSKSISEDFLPIEALRNELINSKDQIAVTSFGAESRVSNAANRRVSNIARNGITSAATSKLLYRLIRFYNLKSIVELGTSFGLNTMYLALTADRSVVTFEGCHNTLNIAKQNFKKLEYSNIQTIEGNIDETLQEYLAKIDGHIDFAYVDANHQLVPTLKYFNLLYGKSSKDTVMVFDDIHWSAAMSKAWKTISLDPRVTLAIDLFNLGIVFFKPELEKQGYKIRY